MNTDWLNLWLWKRKGRMIKRLNPVFIGPSKWVVDACAKSINGKGYPGYAIPNIIDPVFKYEPRLLNSHDKFVILFGAYGGRSDYMKGWHDLETSLASLPDEMKNDCEVQVFGETSEDSNVHGIQLRFLGSINDPIKMRDIYHQADVFAFPSKQETQGMTKVEALLCGLPVVAFNRTACAEGIYHKVNGWVAADGDCAGFCEGVKFFAKKFFDGSLDQIRSDISLQARKEYDEDVIVDKILKAYYEQS